MVIDDDIEMLKQIAVLLENQYTVSLMKSAEQAKASLEESEKINLILLDVDMPETDGFSMIQWLKSNKKLSNIPVIFLTGMLDISDEIKGLTLGGADYIRKPFSREVLMARISVQLLNSEYSTNQNGISSNIAEILTENELKVAEYLLEGYSGKEISEKMFFSYSYIKKLLASLKDKLKASTTNELLRKLKHN